MVTWWNPSQHSHWAKTVQKFHALDNPEDRRPGLQVAQYWAQIRKHIMLPHFCSHIYMTSWSAATFLAEVSLCTSFLYRSMSAILVSGDFYADALYIGYSSHMTSCTQHHSWLGHMARRQHLTWFLCHAYCNLCKVCYFFYWHDLWSHAGFSCTQQNAVD